jgi:hypothetical protein
MDVGLHGRAPVQGPEPRKREIYSRALDQALSVRDVRADVARVARPRANEREELRAFLESKRRLIRSHLHLTSAEKARALADIDRIEANAEGAAPDAASGDDAGGGDGADGEPPLPGGVGFGVFYRPAFKMDFHTGTAAEYTIFCPTRPGGDVHSWLYLAATNRASRCPEAVVAYHGQDELAFAVFDWARPDHWHAHLPLSFLGEYLDELVLNGSARQALRVLTFTEQSGDGRWRNEVYLRHPAHQTFDLVYAFEYRSTLPDQQAGWEGSWGPIVETFQNRYHGTEELGFAEFSVASRRAVEWDPWELLSPEDTYVAQDDVGFHMTHLEPNHTFLAAA